MTPQYTPLPPGSFRLLTLSNSQEDSQSYSLSVHSLETTPAYTAISYAWPSAQITNKAQISLHNQPHQTSPSLQEMLTHLYLHKPSNSPPKIWIDAICINQASAAEKNAQIPLMQAIYSKAFRVIIWLGPHADNSEIAITFIPKIVAILAQAEESPGHLTDAACKSLGLPARGSDTWRAIWHFCRRAWFSRIWILQEASLAQHLGFLCGDGWLRWEVMEKFMARMEKYELMSLMIFQSSYEGEDKEARRSDVEVMGSTQETVSKVSEFRAQRKKKASEFRAQRKKASENEDDDDKEFNNKEHPQAGFRLVDALEYGRERSCTLPVDRIYGMLGLMTPTDRAAISTHNLISYQQPYWRIYIDVAKLFLQTDTELDILCLASSQNKHPRLPSWCPDWHTSQDFTSFGAYTANVAGGHLHHGIDPTSRVQEIQGTDMLQFRGFQVDEILQVVDTSEIDFHGPKKQEDINSWAERVLAWENECLRMSQSLYSHPSLEGEGGVNTNDVVPEEHWRTLIGNEIDDSGTVPSSSTSSLYSTWKADLQTLQHINPKTYTEDFLAGRNGDGRYQRAVSGACSGHIFFRTRGGRIGLGPREAKKGDKVCVLFHGAPLFVLRGKNGDKDVNVLVGDAYVHGLMYGEAFSVEEGRGEETDFVLC